MANTPLYVQIYKTMLAAIKNGEYKDYPHLIRHFRTDKLKITCDKESPINLDGELRMCKEVEFSVAKEKLRFFYPKGLTWQNAVQPEPAEV